MLIFRSGNSFVSPTMHSVTSKTRNWLDIAWKQTYQFQVQSSIIVHFDCRRRQWSTDPFPFKIFLSPLRRLCWLWCVLMRDNNVVNTLRSSVVRGMVSVRTGVRFLLSSRLCRQRWHGSRCLHAAFRLLKRETNEAITLDAVRPAGYSWECSFRSTLADFSSLVVV